MSRTNKTRTTKMVDEFGDEIIVAAGSEGGYPGYKVMDEESPKKKTKPARSPKNDGPPLPDSGILPGRAKKKAAKKTPKKG